VPTLAELRRCADSGDWENAIRCGERLVALDNLNPLVHLHQGLIQEQLGNHCEAERELRRSIYLDRNSILAHYYLGLLLRSRGEARGAARSFGNALDLLALRDDSDTVTPGEGEEVITVKELRNLAKMQLATLGEQS
jgi:chemotaxis protein methyltransferase CheR